MDIIDKTVLGNELLTPAQLRLSKPIIAQRAQNASRESNLMAMGNIVASSEGTIKASVKDPYAVGFGFRPIDTNAPHDGVRVPFTVNGKKDFTTAAGKYQFIKPTWDDYLKANKKPLNSPMTPENQEDAFRWLLKRRGAYDAAAAGDFSTAIEKLGKEFASLPTSTSGQPKRSWEYVAQNLKDQGLDPAKYLNRQIATKDNGINQASVLKAFEPTSQEAADEQKKAIVEQMFAQEEAAKAQQAEQARMQAMQQQEMAVADQQATAEAESKANQISLNLRQALGIDKVFSLDADSDKMPSSLDGYFNQLVKKYV
jgi:muramidase (phage lysozyme)